MMERGKYRKKVYSQIKQSSSVQISVDRDSNGFAYTIIPDDLERDDYLKIVYQTGYVLLITSDREVIRDVKVPNHLIDLLTFPQESGEYGDLVSWSAVKQHNQVYLTGIYTKPGQFHPYLENVTVNTFNSPYRISVSVDGNVPVYLISLDSEDDTNGAIEFKAKGGGGISSVRLKTDGVIELNADNQLIGTFENKIEINIGTEKNKKSQLVIEKDVGLIYTDQFDNSVRIIDGNIQINSTKISLGEGDSPIVLGDKLKSLLSDLISEVAKITVICASPGSPSSLPVNVAQISDLSSQLTSLLSTKVVTE